MILIKFISSRFRVLLAAAAGVLAGCATAPPMTTVEFPHAAINGHPARMQLDTGASSTVLFPARVKRLGLKAADISEPTPVTVAGQSFTAPIPMIHLSLAFRLAFMFEVGFLPDGLVGWPEIRDNILVFDPDRRTIHRVETLPPETAHWLKLKVIPSSWLLLEIPLADGKTGALEVDTGSVFGVEMPPEQWQVWKSIHPQAHLGSRLGGVGSFGLHIWKMAWADEIKLGSLTLTEVPVEDMPANQGAFIHGNAPGAEAVWTIGMRALSRMDLVVDAGSGFAYVHPKPAPDPASAGSKPADHQRGSTNAPASDGSWSVADDVRLRADNLFVLSGNHRFGQEDWTGALKDFNRALEINPGNGGAYARRGVARQLTGDFAGARSDYDQFIEVEPNASGWQRLYRQTSQWRLGGSPDNFATTLASFQQGWVKTIGRFLARELDERALLAAAEKSDGESVAEQKSDAFYYVGARRLSEGDKAGARVWFKKCRAAGMKNDDEYHFAGAELKRLEERAKPESKR